MTTSANPDPHVTAARRYWNGQAATFDEEPDHGLTRPEVAAAWSRLLVDLLPPPPATVLDVGCGTGSLSVLMAEQGHRVTGIDCAPAMLAHARAKAAARGFTIGFHLMDAAAPTLPGDTYDAILCRHVLWALPDPAVVLNRWAALLRPAGRLILIEGYWHTGGGLHATEIEAMLPPNFTASLRNLSDQPDLWGGPVTDERYALVAAS